MWSVGRSGRSGEESWWVEVRESGRSDRSWEVVEVEGRRSEDFGSGDGEFGLRLREEARFVFQLVSLVYFSSSRREISLITTALFFLCLPSSGRILGTYIDASQPYHTHPIYTYASTRVASRFLPSPPSSSKTTISSSSQPQTTTTTTRSPHHPTNPSPLFPPVSAAERSFYSQLNRSSNPIRRVPSDSESDSLPEIVPVTRRRRIPVDFGSSDFDVGSLRQHGLSREEANERLVAIRTSLQGISPSMHRGSNDVNNLQIHEPASTIPLEEISDADSDDPPGILPLATVDAQTLLQRPVRFHPSTTTATTSNSQSTTQTGHDPISISSDDSSSSSLDREDSMPILRRPRNTLREADFREDGGHRNSSILNSLSASVLDREDAREFPYLVTGPPLLSSAALADMVERGNERTEQQERVRDCLDLESLRAARARILGSRRRREEAVGNVVGFGGVGERGRMVGR